MSGMTFFRTCPNFYKPQAMRSLEKIWADILALEQETEGLLEKIIGTMER